MGKAIMWALVILGALVLARVLAHSKSSGAAKSAARRASQAPRSASPDANPEAMVRCAHCGVHLPRSEATLIGADTWCSHEHARLGARNLG